MSSIIVNANNIINTTTNSTFQLDFDRTVNLIDKHISLTSASMYFSWRNITTQNNKFSYIWIDDIEYYVVLPIGLYEITDIRSYFQFVMSQNNHTMTSTETGSTIFFIDFVVSNTNYSIDILTYPVPASLPTGFTSDISFIGVDKNPRLTKDELLYMYLQATKQKFDVFIINLDKSDNERYRHNFLDYYQTDSKDLKI